MYLSNTGKSLTHLPECSLRYRHCATQISINTQLYTSGEIRYTRTRTRTWYAIMNIKKYNYTVRRYLTT